MSYSSQAELSRDPDFLSRVAACAAVEVPKPNSPTDWANQNIWWISAAPGFADAYEFALNSDPPVERPGNDPAVITDGQILAAVQGLLAEQATQPEEPT